MKIKSHDRQAMVNFLVALCFYWSRLRGSNPERSITIERHETGCVSLQRLYCSRIPAGNDRWEYMRRRPDLYGPLVGPADKFNHYDELGYPNAELESILDLACQGGSK